MNIFKTIKEHTKNGTFSWNTYCKPGNHDHKFGPTVSDYISQMPFVGLFAWCLFYVILCIAIVTIKPIIFLMEKRYEIKEKSNRQSRQNASV